MATRKPMVAGNWKMNGSLELVEQLSTAIKNVQSDELDIVVFPPFPLLSSLQQQNVTFGSQTVSENQAGAFTGEVDAQLVKDLGATYTLVGHSERRSIYGESDEVVADKFARAQQELRSRATTLTRPFPPPAARTPTPVSLVFCRSRPTNISSPWVSGLGAIGSRPAVWCIQ